MMDLNGRYLRRVSVVLGQYLPPVHTCSLNSPCNFQV